MNHPDKIYPINFAGFFDLKDEPYYEGKSMLNVEDYPEAEDFADEVCRRWNLHADLLEALLEVNNRYSQLMTKKMINKIRSAISKAKP